MSRSSSTVKVIGQSSSLFQGQMRKVFLNSSVRPRMRAFLVSIDRPIAMIFPPRYLSDTLSRVADVSSRSRLRSSTSSQIMVRPSRLVTVVERSLASAGPRLCSLPDNITTASSSSLSDFRRTLKTHLFRQSYPDIVWLFFSPRWTLKLFLRPPYKS